MWVSIRDNCVGCGACAVISPEVFEMHGRKATVNQNHVHWNEDDCIDALASAMAHPNVVPKYRQKEESTTFSKTNYYKRLGNFRI